MSNPLILLLNKFKTKKKLNRHFEINSQSTGYAKAINYLKGMSKFSENKNHKIFMAISCLYFICSGSII